jgi:hypothetical protein
VAALEFSGEQVPTRPEPEPRHRAHAAGRPTRPEPEPDPRHRARAAASYRRDGDTAPELRHGRPSPWRRLAGETTAPQPSSAMAGRPGPDCFFIFV